ncbi:Transcriptional regulator, AraC family protein [Minicystis rosea]|nr:Transcriptional regulator, AraC family protein [Minicystis rosea]
MTQHAYALDITWPALLKGVGVRLANVLRRAELPDDLFARPFARLETAAYFRFWEAIEAEAGDGAFPLRIYDSLRSESFSPPLFAALCSPNLLTALSRLSRYKPLVGPLRLDVVDARDEVVVHLQWLEPVLEPPTTLAAAELLFFVSLARMGTHEHIHPKRVTMKTQPPQLRAYEEFVGVPIRTGKGHSVAFSRADATTPFLSSNDAMWAVFEPELRRRLAELDASATTAERVRATLLEALPGGNVAMDGVARRLALSKRTLQRRLEDEGTSYQDVLRETRLELARHYLERTMVPLSEISFLLGFEETNSFFRAFSDWTGTTPETIRRDAQGIDDRHNPRQFGELHR